MLLGKHLVLNPSSFTCEIPKRRKKMNSRKLKKMGIWERIPGVIECNARTHQHQLECQANSEIMAEQ